ncbi:MAG: polysaccharide deacetylase family protein [Nannocystales bacterium]
MRLLTFDIEDWFHILEHEPTADPRTWPRFESRVRRGTERILEALARHQQRATFFCLGWVAERCPAVVRAIDEAGHEIGTHSYAHQMVHQLTPAAFEADLARSIGILCELTGKPVTSYRAPGFSITAQTPWAFESLLRAGIETDASLFPTWRMHGGFRGAMRRPGWIETPSGRLREFPMSLSSVAELPVAGGGYFRLFPSRLVHALIRREPYVMTYFHPRDFDAGQPTIPGLSALRCLRSYVGVSGGFAKFERMLRAFRFVDLAEATARVDWAHAPTMRPVPGHDGGTTWELVPSAANASTVTRFAKSA